MFAIAYCLAVGAFVYFLLVVMLESRIRPWSGKGLMLIYLIVLFLAMGYACAVDVWLASQGGSASAGKVVGDRYFLGNHGEHTQVSQELWQFSYWHGWIRLGVLGLFFTTVIGLSVLEVRRKTSPSTGRNDGSMQAAHDDSRAVDARG